MLAELPREPLITLPCVQDEQNNNRFFCFQLGMPISDHASEKLSREAKRLDSSEQRGTLAHASLKTFLLLFLIFSLAPNWSS